MPVLPDEIRFPAKLQLSIEQFVIRYLFAANAPHIDFSRPHGEPALTAADSISWRIFKNPVTLFIGGTAAVILELAEPSVCAGVWTHTHFREDPLRRLRNTGLAAMATVYAAKSEASAMIERVATMHQRVAGSTSGGRPYRADDPALLRWVYATASFGFVQAHHAYAHELHDADFDLFYAEGLPAAHLYGAHGSPRSRSELATLFAETAPQLAPSSPLFEFLKIMASRPLLPAQLHRLQPMLVRAAIDIIPDTLRNKLRLGGVQRLHSWERLFLRSVARFADRLVLSGTPPVLACQRMGLPDHYLYRSRMQNGRP